MALLAICVTLPPAVWLSDSAVQQAIAWLAGMRRQEGGWAPCENVHQSTWVTSLVLMLPKALLSRLEWKPGLHWLVGQAGRESSWVQRARSLLITGRLEPDRPDGWPFFPGTAAWVAPTAFALLALRKVRMNFSDQLSSEDLAVLDRRLKDGVDFLVARRCADGGWNHGSTRALGYDSASYPESTGLVLASLKGVASGTLTSSIALARNHHSTCRSLEAARWLEIGLLAHGESVNHRTFPDSRRSRGTLEIAIDMIGSAASLSNGLSILDAEHKP